MLYVFHVDVGRMMSFDMNVAVSSVENLKDRIERLHGIPATNIVLLVSGGEVLTPSTQVSSYSAGTDTNPIYMFLTGDNRIPASIPQIESDLDIREQVERSLDLPASYDTVEKRAKLALRMYELAREEEILCERLVHEQHLQQQGWYAVIANMEDLTNDFCQRFHKFCAAFDHHLKMRNKYLELLQTFADDLDKLSRIPILPGLMSFAEADFHGFDNVFDTDDVFSNTQQQSVLLAKPLNEKPSSSNLDTTEITVSNSSISTSPNKKAKISSESSTDIAPPAATAVPGSSDSVRSESQTTNSTSSSKKLNSLNLLQWITSKENNDTLQTMSNECIQVLSTFNEGIYENLKREVQQIIRLAEQSDVKEIKGLGDRLSQLEEFIYKIKGMVKDQKELSTGLQQNQSRAMNLGDPSVLPQLCASHKSQLVVMHQNHQKLSEHRRRIAKAKDELGSNLHTRLKRIVWIENGMSEVDNRMLFYHRYLKRAERHICIIEQIHHAPCMYVAAVTEVVRRRIFSGEFRKWATKLSEDFLSLHCEEINRRQIFNASFEGHFLNILFPGMNDMPPSFANDNSLVFDTCLPNLTKSDIDILTSQLPDLANQIKLPEMESVINFFVSRSGDSQNDQRIDDDLLTQQVANALNVEISCVGSSEKPLQHQRLSDLQKEAASSIGSRSDLAAGGSGAASSDKVGCEESETDTETEFEQLPAAATQTQTIATSTSENIPIQIETLTKSTATESLLMKSAQTLTEENESSSSSEIKRLRALLNSMSEVSFDCLKMARTDMLNIRSNTVRHGEILKSELSLLSCRLQQMQKEFAENEMKFQENSDNQAQEIDRLKHELLLKSEELEKCKIQLNEMDSFRIKCATMETQMEELNDKLKSAHDDMESAIAAAKEELNHEHKTEIESLRCRFKLMTSMEHCPSDSNLERMAMPSTSTPFDKYNSPSISSAELDRILAEQKAKFEAEKEKILSAIEIERSIWQTKIVPLNSESVMANVNVLKEMLEEKERQLDQWREKDRMLTAENSQLKTRLDALTNDECTSWLKEKLEYLSMAKYRLEEELSTEKARRLEIESNFAALRNSTYEPGTLSRSKSSSSGHRFLTIDSCLKGDIVFVVWSMKHGQFIVLQDSSILHFVHADCLASLKLRFPLPGEGQVPLPFYSMGRVIEKEYCQAKKDENRYHVPKGSKFYRVKLDPSVGNTPIRRERLESYSSSSGGRVMSQSGSQSEVISGSGRLIVAATTTTKPSALSTNINNKSKDVVDAKISTSPANSNVVVSSVTTTTTTSCGGQIALTHYKERTVSITSVAEEEEEPLSIRSERCHYTSVSEEDEFVSSVNIATTKEADTTAIGSCVVDDVTVVSSEVDRSKDCPEIIKSLTTSLNATATSSTTPTANVSASTSPVTVGAASSTNQQETVITEQPTSTATKELKMQLMLASADIVTHSTPQLELENQQDTITSTLETTTTATRTSSLPELSDISNKPTQADKILSSQEEITSTTTTTTIATLPLTTSNVAKIETIVDNLQKTTTTTENDPNPLIISTAAIHLPNEPNKFSSICSTPIPASIGTSEDSDEYRSLEAPIERDPFWLSCLFFILFLLIIDCLSYFA